MPNRLKNLAIKRVDLVDIPANLDAKTGAGSFVKFWKRGEEPTMSKRTSRREPTDSEVFKSALGDVETLLDGAEPIAKDALASDATVRERLLAIRDKTNELLGDEADDADPLDAADGDEDEDGELSLSQEELDEAVAESIVQACNDIAEENGLDPDEVFDMFVGGADTGDDADGDDPDDEDDDAAFDADEELSVAELGKRGVPVEIAKRMSTLAKRADEAEARAERAERTANGERDQRILRGFVEEASDFAVLPIDPEKDGPVFKRMSENLSSRDAGRIMELLRAADGQLAAAQGIDDNPSVEVGKRGDREGRGGSAYEQLETIAKSIVKKDGKGMTIERAMVKAGEENPDIYKRYIAEQRARSRQG